MDYTPPPSYREVMNQIGKDALLNYLRRLESISRESMNQKLLLDFLKDYGSHVFAPIVEELEREYDNITTTDTNPAYEQCHHMIDRFHSLQGPSPRTRNSNISRLPSCNATKPQVGKQCPICLVNIRSNQKVIFLECTHFFHGKCIVTWLKENNTCPICKTEIHS
jgi:hypothetical protein